MTGNNQTAKADAGKPRLTLVPRRIIWAIARIREYGKRHLEDCLDCTIAKYEDGYIYCPLTWSGRSCEECMEIFERRMERDD